jgi:hypothetical protein
VEKKFGGTNAGHCGVVASILENHETKFAMVV